MKRESCILRKTILGMFVLFAVGIGHAQYESQLLKVKTPFTFNVGTQTFPAGQYSLRPPLQNTLMRPFLAAFFSRIPGSSSYSLNSVGDGK
jgi:hypothetical protein